MGLRRDFQREETAWRVRSPSLGRRTGRCCIQPNGQDIIDIVERRAMGEGTRCLLSIKLSLGKLTVEMPTEVLMTQQLTRNDIDVLPITVAHLVMVSTLPFHHRDPFDRLLIAQAIVEQIPIVSVDPAFDAYPVQRLW